MGLFGNICVKIGKFFEFVLVGQFGGVFFGFFFQNQEMLDVFQVILVVIDVDGWKNGQYCQLFGEGFVDGQGGDDVYCQVNFQWCIDDDVQERYGKCGEWEKKKVQYEQGWDELVKGGNCFVFVVDKNFLVIVLQYLLL